MADRQAEELLGSAMDIADFGQLRYWTGADAATIEGHAPRQQDGAYAPEEAPEQGGRHIGLEWEHPRQFSRVVAHYKTLPERPERVKLQYWNHTWPAAREGGWTAVDDPFNGRWVTAHGDVCVDGTSVTYTLDPLDFPELERAEDFSVTWRQALRLRLLFREGQDALIERLEVFSTSIWQKAELRISAPGVKTLTIRNGRILKQSVDAVEARLEVLYAGTSAQRDEWLMPIPPDQTVVSVQPNGRLFSFAVEDALAGPIEIPDLGATITEASHTNPPGAAASRPIYDRVTDEPEQTWERARREIPELVKIRQGRYVPLGCHANRQEFALRFNGHVYADKHAMKASGRDTARLLWPGSSIEYLFPTMDPPDFRDRKDAAEQSAMDGCLPIYTTRWQDRDVEFTKTDFSALLFEGPEGLDGKRGDEPTSLFSRVTMRNVSERPLTATLWFAVENPELLECHDGFVYATGRIAEEHVPWHRQAIETRLAVRSYPEKLLRARFLTDGPGRLTPAPCSRQGNFTLNNAVRFDVALPPRASHTLDIQIPFITLRGEEAEEQLQGITFSGKLAEMESYWRTLADAGAQIRTPETLINDFVKATVPHVAITADKDVESGLYLLPAGTYAYNVCANEAMHQVRALDFRGYHEEARRYLTPFVVCQGSRPLHGRYRGAEGVLHGLRVSEDVDYQMFNYSLDHGFVLFALCEHYFLTRDRQWAASITDNLIAACDFVTRERQQTRDAQGMPHPKEAIAGLLPPGHLEDNQEWLFWFAVNAHCYRGMAATAEVLADIGHPQAARIRADAEEYRKDIRACMRWNMECAPVVRLADGTCVPFTPTRAGLYSRDLGWIRDSLYGPIHAIECEVLDALEDESTWILKDSEDNVFVSIYRGRSVDLETRWFSQGGNTIQSGLLPMPMVYIKRDQPRHAVRCLLNAFAQNIYADVRCFTEHPVQTYGVGFGPFYKTPDECCWVNWLRSALLSESGMDALRLAPAVPLEWMRDGHGVSVRDMATYFGPVSYSIVPETSSRQITAEITPPRRNAPARLDIRLRHPDGLPIRSVKVNGEEWERFDAERSTVALDGRTDYLVVKTRYY